MWFDDTSPSLGDGGNSYSVSLTYMFDSKGTINVGPPQEEIKNLDARINTNYYQKWYQLKKVILLKPIILTGQIKKTEKTEI